MGNNRQCCSGNKRQSFAGMACLVIGIDKFTEKRFQFSSKLMVQRRVAGVLVGGCLRALSLGSSVPFEDSFVGILLYVEAC